MKSSVLLIPVTTAFAGKPEVCVIKTVQVTNTVWVDPVNFLPFKTEKHTPAPSPAPTPTYTYTYTSVKSCSKGDVVTWNGRKTTLATPGNWPVVVTKKWKDPKDWPATWTEVYTSLSICLPGQTISQGGAGGDYVLKTSSTSTCLLTRTHTGPPSYATDKLDPYPDKFTAGGEDDGYWTTPAGPITGSSSVRNGAGSEPSHPAGGPPGGSAGPHSEPADPDDSPSKPTGGFPSLPRWTNSSSIATTTSSTVSKLSSVFISTLSSSPVSSLPRTSSSASQRGPSSSVSPSSNGPTFSSGTKSSTSSRAIGSSTTSSFTSRTSSASNTSSPTSKTNSGSTSASSTTISGSASSSLSSSRSASPSLNSLSSSLTSSSVSSSASAPSSSSNPSSSTVLSTQSSFSSSTLTSSASLSTSSATSSTTSSSSTNSICAVQPAASADPSCPRGNYWLSATYAGSLPGSFFGKNANILGARMAANQVSTDTATIFQLKRDSQGACRLTEACTSNIALIYDNSTPLQASSGKYVFLREATPGPADGTIYSPLLMTAQVSSNQVLTIYPDGYPQFSNLLVWDSGVVGIQSGTGATPLTMNLIPAH